jgi:hypothetical protein
LTIELFYLFRLYSFCSPPLYTLLCFALLCLIPLSLLSITSFFPHPSPRHTSNYSVESIMEVSHRGLVVAVLVLASSASAQSTNLSTSTSTIVSSLVLNLVIFAVEVSAFFLLRAKFPKIYRPKTYLGLQEERVAPLSNSYLGWIPQFIKTPTSEILYKNGLDAYQFVAFCEMMVSYIAFPRRILL